VRACRRSLDKLHAQLLASRGKLLVELVETLSGKQVGLCACAKGSATPAGALWALCGEQAGLFGTARDVARGLPSVGDAGQ